MITPDFTHPNRQSWERRYATDAYVFGTRPEPFLTTSLAPLPAGAQVLALGAGEGRNEAWLTERGIHAHLVDLSARGLAKAVALAIDNPGRLTTEVADLTAYEWPRDRYDAVTWMYAHFPPGASRSIFAGAAAALRPGGLLVGSVFADHTGADADGARVPTRYRDVDLEAWGAGGTFEALRYGTKRRGARPPERTLQWAWRRR